MSVGVSRIRCLVVDDHEALRSGVTWLLDQEHDMEVAGHTGDPIAAVALLTRRRPHVVICDLQDGEPELARRMIAAGASVVVYTGREEMRLVEAALDADVSGYVLKRSPMADLVRAVRVASAGQVYLDASLAAAFVRRRGDGRTALSPREREVLQHLAEGLTTDAVANKLFLSPATVRSYAESAAQKLDSRNRTHAVAQALRLELIS